jgi:tRNA A37 threonylcarbamoyladenosine dehydratase
MPDQFSRSQILLGKEGIAKLARCRVAVFGIGGVGGYSVEALVRAGIGTVGLFDDDKICLTNLNRQIHATRKTIGLYKTDAAEARIREINPAAVVRNHKLFYSPETSASVDLSEYDYLIDAVDTVSCKIELIVRAKGKGVPVISCMGAGNKLNPAAFEVADIYETAICPLAKVMRHELRKRGVQSLKVVYSKEPPLTPLEDASGGCKANCVCPPGTLRTCAARRQIPGSVSFVPSAAGLILAGEVIRDLIKG